MDEQYKLVVNMLPDKIKRLLLQLDKSVVSKVTEIRLRSLKPLALTLHNSTIYPFNSSYTLTPNNLCYFPSSAELNETVMKLCNNSVYSHEQELAEGYLILPGGHRTGICGKIIVKQDNTRWITDISSINIRISREVKGFSQCVIGEIMNSSGIVICGPPHSGKTTFLRDYICNISNRGERVSLVDCRGEIAAVRDGVCGLDVGVNTDVITGGTKSEGIERALRTMTPDVIAFDEISGKSELNSIVDCLNSGVKIVTTIHVSGIDELYRRNQFLPLLNIGIFTHAVFLDLSHKVKVVKIGDICAEDIGSSSDSNFFCCNGCNQVC